MEPIVLLIIMIIERFFPGTCTCVQMQWMCKSGN